GVDKQLALNIEAEVKAIGQNSRGLKTKLGADGRDYFGFIRSINCPSIISEMAFIDNLNDINDFNEEHEIKRYGVAVAKGILKTLNIKYNGTTPTPGGTPSTSDLYRVRKSWGDAVSQKGAYSSLENAKNECNKYAGYGVYDNKGIKVYPTSAPTPPPAPSNKKYLNLKPHMQSWKIYNQSGPYTTNKAIASLAPSKFGGLSYEILGSPQTDVHLIQTEQFGKVAIYAPRDNDSSITTSKLY
ncbi:MAG: N-acetylmuramoyl-L-alanine amidase, partial [Clostridium sp.]